MNKKVLLAMASAVTAGCVSNPSKITLRDALYQVGEALVYSQIGRDEALARANAKPRNFGLYPAEVLVTFNVSAGSTISAEGSGSAATLPGSPTLKLAGAWTGNRGNSITVKYQSMYYRLPGQVGADLPPSSDSGGSTAGGAGSGGGSSKGGSSGGGSLKGGSSGGGNSKGGTSGGNTTHVAIPPPEVTTLLPHDQNPAPRPTPRK